MAVRIVHFGGDNCNRVAALKSMGYSIDECNSLAQLHAALVGVLETDAVAIAENDGAAPDHTISMIRATSTAPLILLRSRSPHYNEADFDLVVPFSSRADEWLGNVAELIGRSMQRTR